MLSKLAVTTAAMIFLLVLPVLEINETHVFNPAWPEHARLHEVWQLCVHALFSGVCLWLVWVRREERFASLLALAMTGSFVFAYLIRETYGGSMRHVDGEPVTTLSNAAVVIVLCVSALLVAGIFQARPSLGPSSLEKSTHSSEV